MASVRDYFTARITPLEDACRRRRRWWLYCEATRSSSPTSWNLPTRGIASASEDRTIGCGASRRTARPTGSPDVLSGHTDAVRCLVALQDGRLWRITRQDGEDLGYIRKPNGADHPKRARGLRLEARRVG